MFLKYFQDLLTKGEDKRYKRELKQGFFLRQPVWVKNKGQEKVSQINLVRWIHEPLGEHKQNYFS